MQASSSSSPHLYPLTVVPGFIRGAVVLGLLLASGGVFPGELAFDFTSTRPGTIPSGFRSTVAGEGPPGDWQILEVPLQTSPRTGTLESDGGLRQSVLAQLSRDPTDEHFPILIFDRESFADFTLSAKVRMMEGAVEQMAGLAFRIRDEKNFYVLRLSSLGGNVRFYKMVDGVRSTPLGVNLPVARGEWHELKVECLGNQIRCWLQGQELFPALTDNSFTEGRIGLWTKSDSVSHFADLKVVYAFREILAQRLVRQGLEEFSRLVSLKISAAVPGVDEVKIIASPDPEDLGKPASDSDQRAAREGAIFHGTSPGVVTVVLPLRDRNGDPVASLRVTMKSFPGQTRDNALARSKPVADWMQKRFKSLRDLSE